MTSKAEKRRNKKARREIDPAAEFALAPTPRREKNGRVSRAGRPRVADERETVIQARMRQMGWSDTRDNRAAAKSDMLCCDAGRAIWRGMDTTEQRVKLWAVFCGLHAAEYRYAKLHSKNLFAKVAKIEYLQDRIEAEDAEPCDLRTEEERDRAITRNWMHWRGLTQHLTAHEITALYDGLLERAPIFENGWQTTHGKAFIAALRTLAVHIEAVG